VVVRWFTYFLIVGFLFVYFRRVKVILFLEWLIKPGCFKFLHGLIEAYLVWIVVVSV